MKRIVIDNFGPIKHVDVNLDKSLNVVIGPQASGKSTFAKIIYFCRKIRDYLAEYINRIITEPERSDLELYTNFLKFLRNPFMGCFGTTKHMKDFSITYYMDDINEKYVKINLMDHYANFRFSPRVKLEITKLIGDAIFLQEKNQFADFTTAFLNQKSFVGRVRQETNRIFCDDMTLLYIPAGRNLLATLSDQISIPSTIGFGTKVDIDQTDLITQDFIRYISTMRHRFSGGLLEITKDYLKTEQGQIRNHDVDLACELIRRILKGEYICDRDGEKVYYDKEHWVKLMFASSGQQEILWGLNIIFMQILKNEKTFLVFEEPESHLFPNAQNSIAELVALMINSSKSELLITTHSPYMLTSFNLLIYSGKVEVKSAVVEKAIRLKNRAVGAFYLTSAYGDFVNLIGPSTGLIDAQAIDQITEAINDKMDQLFEIDYESEG